MTGKADEKHMFMEEELHAPTASCLLLMRMRSLFGGKKGAEAKKRGVDKILSGEGVSEKKMLSPEAPLLKP